MSDKKKPDLAKQAQKKFYQVFNDKSPLRRVVFSAAFVVAPTILVGNVYDETVSTTRPAGAEQRVADYNKEIDALANNIPTKVLTFNKTAEQPKLTLSETEKLADVKKRANDFSSRLLWETGISEKDAQDIATRYSDTLGEALPNTIINWTKAYAPYLDESRSALAKDPKPDTEGDMQNQMFKEFLTDNAWSNLIAFALFFGIFDGWLKRGLSHGRRKDDQNIYEEKVEKFEEVKNDLKDILMPKSPPTPPPDRFRP